jgi:hypothetical protein
MILCIIILFFFEGTQEKLVIAWCGVAALREIEPQLPTRPETAKDVQRR